MFKSGVPKHALIPSIGFPKFANVILVIISFIELLIAKNVNPKSDSEILNITPKFFNISKIVVAIIEIIMKIIVMVNARTRNTGVNGISQWFHTVNNITRLPTTGSLISIYGRSPS